MTYELYTNRLTLRPLQVEDADAITEQIGEWEVIKWLGMPPYPYARSEAENFIQKCQVGDSSGIVRALDANGQLLGTMGLSAPKEHWGLSDSALELGYWIGQSHWGQGYASEAARAMLVHAFETLHVHEVVASVFTDNAGSRKVLEKSGFDYDGDFPFFCVPRGEVVTSLRMRLSRNRWHALNMVG